MDLDAVISELRTELENIKQVTEALERLHELREGRGEGFQQALKAEVVSPPAKPKARRNGKLDTSGSSNDSAA